jgi:NADH-quinone oxidoreductase subunit N
LRPVVQMYMSEPIEGWSGIRVAPLVTLALVLAVVGVIVLGVFPAPAIALAQSGLLR